MSLSTTPISGRAEFDRLNELAKSEGSTILYPTHVFRKKLDGEDQIVGEASVCGIPLVDLWLHKGKTGAKDWVEAVNKTKDLCRGVGLKTIVIRVDPDCTSRPILDRFDIHFMKNVDLYFCDL